MTTKKTLPRKKTAVPKIKITDLSVLIPKELMRYQVLKGLTTFQLDESELALAKDKGKHTEIPRYFFTKADLLGISKNIITKSPGQSSRGTFSQNIVMKLKDGFSVRSNQKLAWEALKQAKNGVLNLACGKGKTFLALNKVCLERRKVLIIAPQVAHLNNWKAELENFFKFTGKIGWIRGKVIDVGDITFATVQTLARDPEKYQKILGDAGVRMVIFDECHCMSARYFSKAADIVGPMRIGLSATPNRRDRNEGIFSAHVGKVFFSDTVQDLVPTIRIIYTLINKVRAKNAIGNPGTHIAHLRSYLAEHEERNSLIIDLINKKLKEGRTVYVLSHVVAHVEWIAEQFKNSTFIHGGVAADKRLELLNSGNPVVATINIGREAYNRADLDTLFIVTPFSADSHSAITLEQSIGRILRAHPSKKKPEVFLFRDPDVNPLLSGMMRSVVRESKRRGYTIVDEEKEIKRRMF